MSNRGGFDGEKAMRRLLRHAYRLKTKDPEQLPPRYQKTAVMDLRTLREEIEVIDEQFGEAYDVDVEFDFDVDAGVLTPRRSADPDSGSSSGSDDLREILEENEDMFKAIANNDSFPPEFRERFGQRPLDKLAELRTETD